MHAFAVMGVSLMGVSLHYVTELGAVLRVVGGLDCSPTPQKDTLAVLGVGLHYVS